MKNVTSKELLELTNKGEHNILPKKFGIDWLFMLLLSQSKPFEHTQSSNPYWGSQSWKSNEIEFSNLERAFELFENVKKNVGNISRSHFERMSKKNTQRPKVCRGNS